LYQNILIRVAEFVYPIGVGCEPGIDIYLMYLVWVLGYMRAGLSVSGTLFISLRTLMIFGGCPPFK